MASCASPPSSSRSLQLPPTAEEENENDDHPPPSTVLRKDPLLNHESSFSIKPSSSRLLIPPSDASAISSGSIQPQSARDLIHLTSNLGSGVTYAGQDSLPRLPIPDLHETMEKFQYRLEALQDETQRELTKRVVQEFLDGEGPKLQEALREYEAEGIADERIGVSFSM
jgi:Choline/Carnitine o-acyltransferase